jgi:hypothetical protein
MVQTRFRSRLLVIAAVLAPSSSVLAAPVQLKSVDCHCISVDDRGEAVSDRRPLAVEQRMTAEDSDDPTWNWGTWGPWVTVPDGSVPE